MIESKQLDKVASEGPGAVSDGPKSSPDGSGPLQPEYRNLSGLQRGGTPGRKAYQLEPAQVETVCLLTAGGVDRKRIAEILGCNPYRVGAVLKKREHKRRVAELQGEMLRHEVEQHFGLMRMLPKSRKVLEDSLERGDAKVRTQVAQWLHESLIAKPATRSELKIQGKVEHDLRPLFQEMGEHLKVLREKIQHRDPLARVQVGRAALVRQQLGSGE